MNELNTFTLPAIKFINLIYPRTKIFCYWKPPLVSCAHRIFAILLCQYVAVDIATAKVIVAEVLVCNLRMLCKCKTAVLAWLSVFQVQYKVFING